MQEYDQIVKWCNSCCSLNTVFPKIWEKGFKLANYLYVLWVLCLTEGEVFISGCSTLFFHTMQFIVQLPTRNKMTL